MSGNGTSQCKLLYFGHKICYQQLWYMSEGGKTLFLCVPQQHFQCCNIGNGDVSSMLGFLRA